MEEKLLQIQETETVMAARVEQFQQYTENIDRLKKGYLTLAGLSLERSKTSISDRRVSYVQASLDMKGVDSNRIREKLQEVQGYIQLTETAMAHIEQQGNLVSQNDNYTRFATLKKSLQHQEGELGDILDPVAGAETWPSEEIANYIVKFQAVLEQVNQGLDWYTNRAPTIDPYDKVFFDNMGQAARQRRQFKEALTKLRLI